MDGGDGGGINGDHGGLKATPVHLTLGVITRCDTGDPRRGVIGNTVCGQHRQHVGQLLAGLLAHLGGGRTGERDHEQLFGAQVLFHHIAGHQGGEGVGLSGAGAGLQQQPSRRQVAVQVEIGHIGHDEPFAHSGFLGLAGAVTSTVEQKVPTSVAA